MSKILVIEDEPEIRENILEALHIEGYEVKGASNGLDGVAIALSWNPDLIICDLRMPQMDGIETLLALRRSPGTSKIPFIFLSAAAEISNSQLGISLGAADYLVKPFILRDFLDAVAARLN